MNPVLEVNDLSVTLQTKKSSKPLLEHVSFSVQAGTCLGILGESGSGKSMTAKAILGLLDRQFSVSGKAIYQGTNLLEQSGESLRRMRGKEIAMILQNPMTCFDPLYRIGDQLAETLAVHTTWSKQEILAQSRALLQGVKIRQPEEELAKYPHQLSGGMLQRVMIGLAMVLHPTLLIADEPTTALDAITQYAVMQQLQEVKELHGTAMIFISHDLGAISCIADHVLVLSKGQVVDEGSFQQILHYAQDPYTKLLVKKRATVMQHYRSALGREQVRYA